MDDDRTEVGRDVVGIDVGGTSLKGARVSDDGRVQAERTSRTPSDAASLTAAVVDLATALRGPATAAVGVASPGVVDDGLVRFAANLPWRDEPVRDRVSGALYLPVVLARDVAAAALAESAQVPYGDVLAVWLGTGIAAAHVTAGEVRGGSTGQAGEIGHVPVRTDGEPCGCGQRGCLEVYASAAGVARRYTARTGAPTTSEHVVQRLGSDPAADAVWGEAVAALAVALATVTLVDDPGAVLLGGGLASAGAALLSPLAVALTARLAWRPAPPLLLARLGPLAGALGAAEVARRAIGDGLREGSLMSDLSAAPAGAARPSLAVVGSEHRAVPR